MKILDVFKSKSGESELDKALAGIIALEKRRTEAHQGLEDAKRALESKTADSVAGDGTQAAVDKAASAVASAAAKVAAADNLIFQAANEAKAIINSGVPARKEKIAELKGKIKATEQAIARRFASELAAFTSRHGLAVQWPRELMAGSITIPIFAGLGSDEVQAIVTASSVDRHVDQDADALAHLLDELRFQNTLANLPPSEGLDLVLAERRRRAV